ncbi:uncharacterized protein ACHE_10792A [Aspergillus chevalieri]|uniref:Small secreted protein n=1 Tax=Aspergillus chevalieri TaxID=182096 RepID=A0A7R7ZI80_ASPCH|nr:uncharacterized protein ACHE_10792A [Aspergillus chevalieri]BCR83390.1 hypothetical protein ACHE_10792A [Aspergillus chevalieri]
MISLKLLTTLLTSTAAIAATATAPDLNTLNVTVIGARNNKSILECWALDPGFTESSQAGTAGSEILNLGSVSGNASYSVIPAKFDGGRHNAPAMQWVVFLSGLAHISLPHSDKEAWIRGGKGGAILALDTAKVSGDGHVTKYPSDEVTVALQVPLKEKVPGHHVLHGGACEGKEVSL